jgi:hypothetical protein
MAFFELAARNRDSTDYIKIGNFQDRYNPYFNKCLLKSSSDAEPSLWRVNDHNLLAYHNPDNEPKSSGGQAT